MSAGGTHIHHSTFGIFGLLGVALKELAQLKRKA